MGKVVIQSHTTKQPITLIGEEAGVCWGADTSSPAKNFKRGLSCLSSGHGRTFEFPDVYMVLDGYSARVIRELYTHIGGSPTRLQASTRYINYENFGVVVPDTIKNNPTAEHLYNMAVSTIRRTLQALENKGIPREDAAMLLPLGMETKIVCKYNLRTLIDMSHVRMCSRAYHEFRKLFSDIAKALSQYSDEWGQLVRDYFVPKCELAGYCTEEKSCGRFPKRGDAV